MSSPLRWCEVSLQDHSRERFGSLSEALTESGIDNQLEFISTTPDQLKATLSDVQARFTQIRLSGEIGEFVFKLSENHPADLLNIRCADAMVSEISNRTGRTIWWPRCFEAEGIVRALAGNLKELNLECGAFIFGATAEARSVVAALVRVGFRKFTLADEDEARLARLIQDFSKSYFQVQFQSVARHLVTQLPNVHSIAVNTLHLGRDPSLSNELSFFNFLQTSGVWLDLSLVPFNNQLQTEAISIGATVLSPVEVAVQTDCLWVESAFGLKMNIDSHRKRLQKICS